MQASDAECPLCMEQLEIDDVNFYPCTCGYQICRFCWHRIRTDENGLCPACRKLYSEDPAIYTPLSQDEIQRILRERKQKDVQRKQKVTENRKHLANVRVVQKNLVFVVGLTQRLADPELLKRPEYFSKFGKIHKIVVNNSTNYAGPQGPSASAYITYVKEEDAIKAIIAVCNTHLDGRTLKASLGTTKYCSYFLRNIPCPKTDCMYLHELGDGAGSFTKDDMQAGKHQEYEQQLIAFYSKKMGLSNDKDSKECWPVVDSSENRVSPCLPLGAAWAGKNEDDTNQPVADGGDSLVPQCKEDWEQSWTPPTTMPDHTSSASITHQQPTVFPQTSQASTGWANAESATRVLETSSLFSGDICGTTGLGLANLHLKVYGDDDLGFDPWNECSKGLADLLQEEEQTTKPQSTQHISTASHTHSFLSAFPRDPDNIRNLQDGLRALLPNININFSDSLLSQQQNTWPPTSSSSSSSSSLVTEPSRTNWPFTSQQASAALQVRPPPGFECKSPSSRMSSLDDPSILWSKRFEPGNASVTRSVSNGFPGMHPLTRPDLHSAAAVSSGERIEARLNGDSVKNINSNTNTGLDKLNRRKDRKEPSTENIKNSIIEGIHSMSSVTHNPVEQVQTRVSELSVINVNDPVQSWSDYDLTTKNADDRLQESRTLRQRRDGETASRDIQRQQQQPGYTKVGKKVVRHNRLDNKSNPRWS